MVFWDLRFKSTLEILKKLIAQQLDMNLCMGDPDEKAWIRDRIEGPEKNITFTENGKSNFE